MNESKLIEVHLDICRELTETYSKKNRDYGDSFHETIQKFGFVAAYVRMDDKLNRAITLSKMWEDAPKVADESLEDTLMDLANYAIMTVMELRRARNEKGE